MALTLTIVDNEDGTGAVATIAGSSGAANIVYTQALAATSWTNSGSRTGDGTVSLSLATGGYHAVVQAGGATFSPLVAFNVTDGALAIHEQCVLAVKARIQALTLAGLPSTQVYDMILPSDTNITYPAVLITIEGEAEEQPLIMTGTDDIGYPVRVWICDRQDSMTTAKRATYLKWRQQIFRALRQRGLAVDGVYYVRVKPMPVVDYKARDFLVLAMGLGLSCVSRETRG